MSYRFALEPKWILSHAAVAALVVAMLLAGLWQLRRHDQRADRNTLIEQRSDLDPVPLAQAADAVTAGDDRQFAPVVATGVYRDVDTVLVANRTIEGSPGFWVMTPLEVADGSTVVVARGFLGRSTALEGDPELWDAPPGSVTITGLVQPSVSGGVLAPDREVAEINRPDVTVLSERAGIEDLGFYLQAESDPVDFLVPVPLPALDAGPHRSYAAQWFIFSLIAVIGYPLILRKVARDRAGTLTADAVPV